MNDTFVTQLSSHFTYWIFVWFVVYVIAKRISNRSRVPSPYWWLVIAACNNLFMVVYTMYLIGSGNLHTTPITPVWTTIILFMLVNTCVKVVPLLLLHYNVLFDESNRPSDYQDHYQDMCLNVSFGIALFVVYLFVCVYVGSPFDEKWFQQRKDKGLLSGDGPLVVRLKHTLRLF